MGHNSKDMCVTEDRVEKIVDSKIELLKSDLTGIFNTHFKGVKKDLKFIKDQTTLTNSRTTKSEVKIEQLYQNRASRETDCPFRDRIDVLEEARIRDETLRDYLDAQEEKADENRKNFYHKMQALGAIITVIVALLAFGVDIVEVIKKLFS